MVDTVIFDTSVPSVAISGGAVAFTYTGPKTIQRFTYSESSDFHFFRITCARVATTVQSYVVATVNTGDGIDAENRLSHTIGSAGTLEGIICTPNQTQTRYSDSIITGIDLACVGTPTLEDEGILASVEIW